MPFSAILLVFKFLMFSFLQFTDLQVHNSIDCPYFYGLSVKISDLLHLFNAGISKGTTCTIFNAYGLGRPGCQLTTYPSRSDGLTTIGYQGWCDWNVGLGTAYRNRTAVYRGTLLHSAVRTMVYRNSIKLTVIVKLSAAMIIHLIDMPTPHGV